MTSTDTKADYTAEETTAYEAYLSALAEHNIVCARSGATTREKMDAAFSVDAAWKRFCEVAGLVPGSTRSPEDIRTIENLMKELAGQNEAIRSACAMLIGIHHIGVFAFRGTADPIEHGACCTLLDDAGTVLRIALAKADGV
ncbi:hypothetical protein [Sphingobium yanoikuyae]|uniref:Uncharacterized protein n=1 Tax=Sphingobium yanoikuyae TaxID=13690 RepID=A0A9X7UCC4_SPHYA|nr:hypothetical protein [Sphingobium yanoikuyae]QNG44677.1 hypothetical protein H3V42_22925 [Sphingobium yanoikuyae]